MRDCGEDVVVQRVLRDPRVLAQQVLGLGTRVHRPARVEEGTREPGVEAVVRVRTGGHRSVAGCAAENRVHLQRNQRVGDLPERPAVPVIEGPQPQIDHGPAPQRLGPREQFVHDTHRGTAQNQPRARPCTGPCAALALVVELLEQSRDLGRMLKQIRQLVDHQKRARRTGRHIKGVGQHIAPVRQTQASRPQTGVSGNRITEPLDRGQSALLPDRRDVQAADLLGQRLQKVRLPVPPAPGHDPEPHRGIRICEELREQTPLPVPVNHVVRLDQRTLLHQASHTPTATDSV